MSEPKHTPGPWKAKDNYIYAPIPDEDDIFAISIAVACAGVAPAISNANLIASAPDMYEALETVCGACIYVKLAGKKCCKYCVINNALRKARGETEPVSNPYKLPHTCETCQHGIWDKDGCYCNRVPSKTHKVCETGTCEHWALNQYIETNSGGMNK